MLSDFLKSHITSQANFVTYGYGQVEPNHLSAQRNGQIYAQLPANSAINVLEQGQFVKYDYAKGEVNFIGEGEWMLVYNETKLYREGQLDCEFAMIKDNYQARIYSPYDSSYDEAYPYSKQSRYYNGNGASGNGVTVSGGNVSFETEDGTKTYPVDDVTAAPDYYELHYNEDPFHIESRYKPQKMKEGTTMVPRVFKTMIGDIFTTNTIQVGSKIPSEVTPNDVAVGKYLAPNASGILTYATTKPSTGMVWQIVKVYTMPDHQKGVKIMRIA